MSGLETAIRTALENIDRHDANQRARVYQSARQALEKGLANQNIKEPGAVARQRRKLDDIITGIEQEEAAAARKAREAAQAPRMATFDDRFAVGRTPDRAAEEMDAEIGAITPGERFAAEPSLDAATDEPLTDFAAEPRFETPSPSTRTDGDFDYPESPVLGDLHSGDAGFTEAGFDRAPEIESGHLDEADFAATGDIAVSETDRAPVAGDVRAETRPQRKSRKIRKQEARAAKRVRKRRGFTSMLIGIIIIAFLLMGGWWMLSSNFTFNPETLDTAVPNPPPRIEAEDFEGASGWTNVFTPGTANILSAGPRASITNATVDNAPAVEIASLAEGDAGAVAIALPVAVRGMLEQGPVLIEISTLAPDGSGQPVAVYCADGTIEGCQRHRFTASAHRDSLVVRLDPARGVLPSRLMISSDLNGTGAPLAIFAIRARAE